MTSTSAMRQLTAKSGEDSDFSVDKCQVGANGMMTAVDFRAWVRRATPRQDLIYHTGDLAYERSKNAGNRKGIRDLADAAWNAADMGLVDLVQTKLEESVFQYRAIKRRSII